MKAIFIDGASLRHMLRVLGVKKCSHRALFSILTERVGYAHVCGKPFYTVAPGYYELAINLEFAGFETVIVQSAGEEDDKLIKKKIEEIGPDSISELVLVSADGGFEQCVWKKAAQGVEIYIVATRLIDPKNGRPMISYRLLKDHKRFHFVELADFKQLLLFR